MAKGFRAILMAAALGVSAFGAAAQERFDGVVLRVATFGGGWDKAVHEFIGIELEKRGGKVEYIAASPRDALARLIAARGREIPFDVLEMADTTWIDTLEGKFLEKIDISKITNKKDLEAFQYDEYKVASWVTQEGIVYDTAKFKEAGIEPPKTYADLASPKLAGKVAMIDVSQAGSVQFLVGATKAAGGTEANIDPALALLKQISPRSYWKVGAEAMTQLQTGEVWAAVMHAGFAIQGRRRDMPLSFVHPSIGKEKGAMKEGWLGIVRGTKVKAAAEFFINAYVDAAAQENLALKRGVVPVNKVALANLSKDPLLKELLILDPAAVPNMLRVNWEKLDPNFTDKWTRATAR